MEKEYSDHSVLPFLSVTAALLIIVSAIVYLIQYTKMYKNMENDIIRTSSSIGDAIDLQISQMDNICLNVINSTSVKDTFAEWSQNKNASAYERRQQQNQLNNSLVSIRGIDTSIRQVNLYSMESGGYGVGNYYGRLSKSTADLPWYKGAVEKDGYRFFRLTAILFSPGTQELRLTGFIFPLPYVL